MKYIIALLIGAGLYSIVTSVAESRAAGLERINNTVELSRKIDELKLQLDGQIKCFRDMTDDNPQTDCGVQFDFRGLKE